MTKIELEAFYPFPIEHVWNALTESESLAQWLMENNFKPELGYSFEFRAKPMLGWDGVARCKILELNKPYKLSWSQCGNDEGKDPFIITWTLKEEGEGTRLSLVHEGIKGIKGMIIKKVMGDGWKRMLNQRLPWVLQYALRNGWHQFPADRKFAKTDCHR